MKYTYQCCVVLKQFLRWFCNPVLTFTIRTVLRARIVCLRAYKNWPSSKLSYLGERIEPSELSRLFSRASRASTFRDIPKYFTPAHEVHESYKSYLPVKRMVQETIRRLSYDS